MIMYIFSLKTLFILTSFTLLLLSNCSDKTNPLASAASNADKNFFDNQIALGQILYDRDNLPEALIAAEKAVEQNPSSKDAAILLGYIYIGIVGFKPFKVIRKMYCCSIPFSTRE